MTGTATLPGVDIYQFNALLTPEERDLRERVRTFCDEHVLPIINDYWERGEFPFEIVPELAKLGLAGGTIRGYGCPGLSSVAVGVGAMELSRGDGSIETFLGVTSGLAMGAIAQFGSEAQKQRWLPAMARLEKIGAFGLTEPQFGSDAAHIQTTAQRVGDRYVLNGAKRWIGNASFADVVVIWARDAETGNIGGFLVEKGTPGFRATVIQGKIAKRSVLNADITLENCEIPEQNRLPLARSFRDTALLLKNTRYGVAWEAVGHAMAAFELARDYSLHREQFGRPIASFQLIQQKLVQMLGDVTAIQLLAWRLSKLRDEDEQQITEGMASLAKQTCAARARQVVALGRELLGGNGILLEYHIARHFADMEAVYTYEGTNEINTLVIGREITGWPAFV
jgi:glutaryl-CoA dehydrogenase